MIIENIVKRMENVFGLCQWYERTVRKIAREKKSIVSCSLENAGLINIMQNNRVIFF